MVRTTCDHPRPLVLDEQLLDRVGRLLRCCKFVMALTGPGILAESPATELQNRPDHAKILDPEEPGSIEAFRADPQKVLNWYRRRRAELKNLQPNPAYCVLAELEQKLPGFFLVTENFDGLHQRAGSKNPIELRGNIWSKHCLACNYRQHDDQADSETSCCPACGDWMRPSVVWFGEPIPPTAFIAALEAAGNCGLLLSIGASAAVQPAASLLWQAKASGAAVVEINTDQALVSPVADIKLIGPARDVLPELARRVN